ncbi:hypothetical protein CUT44_25905 [Streptomyces carminius]|uniref:Uncharacterized protein n=1 Tax=Streptomyces carminius TaxID=2665496 RepID=A0A2M8LT16_9ACTN|nr:hypothetical protein CUT44_25905 [Streptomyces carminius]
MARSSPTVDGGADVVRGPDILAARRAWAAVQSPSHLRTWTVPLQVTLPAVLLHEREITDTLVELLISTVRRSVVPCSAVRRGRGAYDRSPRSVPEPRSDITCQVRLHRSGELSAHVVLEPLQDSLRTALEPQIAVPPGSSVVDPEHVLFLCADRLEDAFEVRGTNQRIVVDTVSQSRHRDRGSRLDRAAFCQQGTRDPPEPAIDFSGVSCESGTLELLLEDDRRREKQGRDQGAHVREGGGVEFHRHESSVGAHAAAEQTERHARQLGA